MDILINKVELGLCLLRLKMTPMGKNDDVQDLHEKIVSLHIRICMAKEQAINKQLFLSK